MTEYLQNHRRVKSEIKEQLKNEACVCVNVNDLADKLHMDPRTVKTHLDIMKIDDYGTYLDDKKTVFCPIEGVERLTDQFKKKLDKR
jgi:predicted ArsR family transcriptional regulator